MFKNFFKILAALTGLSIIGYFLTRKIEIWEIDAAKDAPKPLDPALSAEETTQTDTATPPVAKAPAAEKTQKASDEPKNPGTRAQAEARLESEVADILESAETKTEEEAVATPKEAVKEEKAQPEAAAETAAEPEEAATEDESEGPTKTVEIDFSGIGTASAEEKDDLKKIKGIGKALETKLNSVGIYTYKQIASFTPEVEEQVTEAISFFPGRIERDEWVSQAKALLQEKKA